MITVRALQVQQGDSFMISFQKDASSYILIIDSGYACTYPIFKQNLLELLEQYNCKIQMLLTHIDLDHIGGYVHLFSDHRFQAYDRISAFYYNTMESLQTLFPGATPDMVEAADRVFTNTDTSYKGATTLEKLLKGKEINVVTNLHAGRTIDIGKDIRATVLSPSGKSLEKYQSWVENQAKRQKAKLQTAAAVSDYSQPLKKLVEKDFIPDENLVNASSISLLIEAYGRSLLFLGDALPGDVAGTLRTLGFSEQNRLKADLIKVSHHGSKHNTSPELLSLIEGNCFLVSGNGTPGHPAKETLARILQTQNGLGFWFNYDIEDKIFTELERKEFKIRTRHGMELVLE